MKRFRSSSRLQTGHPATDPPPGRWQYHLIFPVLLLAIGALGARMALLLRDGRGEALARTFRQQRMVIPLPGKPGSIYARSAQRYIPLAVSRQAAFCYADPTCIDEEELGRLSRRLGEALVTDPRLIERKIRQRRSKRYVYLKGDLTEEEIHAVRQLRVRGVRIDYEWRRSYPNGELAATVIGFRRRDGVAGGGVELTQDKALTPIDGKRTVLADAYRRPIWPVPQLSVAPQDGANVFLCLDAVIQSYLQQAVSESVSRFDAKWGTGVVIDPQTGEVLAMCSVPTFNPNEYSTAGADSQTNRAVSVPFEPGSIFKPIVAAAAVEAGLVDYQTQIFCENGTYRAPRGGRISDHGKSYGNLSVAEGVIHSSNICLAKIGEKLGNEQIHQAVRRFGFGEPTGIEMGGESGGIVRPLARWDGYSLRRVPFGQEISATAIQMVAAFGALSNGGLLLQPRLIDAIVDANGRVIYQSRPRVIRRVLSPSVAAQTLGVLQDVVERGTGKNCRLKRWTTFGKTGTAQIAGPGGYVDEAFVGSFIGGGPVERPAVLCLISIYWPDYSKGHYGSQVAAPFVREVLAKTLEYLNVPPDKEMDSSGSRMMARVR